MKRSELYARVWTMPITRLADELGISNVGLAKACRRHAVPVPPRGYWAKLKAGQEPPRTALPTLEPDIAVHFVTRDLEERARLKEAKRRREESSNAVAQSAVAKASVEFASNLDDAHPMVKATQRYCDRLPKLIERYERRGVDAWGMTRPEDRPPVERYGRYRLLQEGFLNITASPDIMDWVLRFHATIFKGLTDGGMLIARRDPPKNGPIGRGDGPVVEARFQGEVLSIEFSQGYRRVYLDAVELAKKRKAHSYVGEFEHRPSENLTFSLLGSEYGARKTWQGTGEKLQAQVQDIVRTAFELIPIQIELRKKRQDDLANARRDAEAAAILQRRADATAEQLKQAFALVEADSNVRRLKNYLDELEQRVADFQPPFDERARVWIRVVRKELEDSDPVESILRDCLTVPSWSTWPPAWWPEDTPAGDPSVEPE